MIRGVISNSVLQTRTEKRKYKSIGQAPHSIQLEVFRETLRDLDDYLDTSDLLKLTSKSLAVIRDDILEIIKGLRALKPNIPLGTVKSLDGTLDELRQARDAVQTATFENFSTNGQLKPNKSRALLADLRSARKRIENSLGFLKP